MVAYKLTSAWAQALLALLPTARVAYLNSLQDAREPELNEHDRTLHFTSASATELHLVAYLSGLLAASATWDELAAVTFGQVLARQNALLASQLPPGVSLPAPEPGNVSLKSSAGLVAAAVIEQLEALFGADAAPLATNRERIAHIIDLA